MNIDFINISWDLYINGWFEHDKIVFHPDGKISNNGTEGFSHWKVRDELLELYDEKGILCYSLKYIPSADIFSNIANHRIKNNHLFLVKSYSTLELEKIFPHDDLSSKIANRSALYKSNSGDIWGNGMFFGKDGVIYNYHNPNEKYWKVEDNILKIYDENNTLSCIQQSISYTNKDSTNTAIKQISLLHLESKDIHHLDFLKIKNAEQSSPVKFLNIDACFSNRSDTLLVIFNSAGGEYNGKDVNHEFYHIPYQFAVDYIRFSQSKPTRIYLDEYEKIENLIAMNTYKNIVLMGMSIGGFASMWFAEMLARKNKNIQYYSIAIQPLTNLGKAFSQSIRMQYSDGYRAKTLTEEMIEEYEKKGLILNISELLQYPLNNSLHYVIYDALNQAEKQSANTIISDRTIHTGLDYGVNHAEGCVRIYDSEVLRSIFKNLLITM